MDPSLPLNNRTVCNYYAYLLFDNKAFYIGDAVATKA
jgi:hypothetical protein